MLQIEWQVYVAERFWRKTRPVISIRCSPIWGCIF